MDAVDRLLADYSRNFPAFLQEEERLEQEHFGEFAAFSEGELVGVYETAEGADTEGAAHGEHVVFKIGRMPLRYAMPV